MVVVVVVDPIVKAITVLAIFGLGGMELVAEAQKQSSGGNITISTITRNGTNTTNATAVVNATAANVTRIITNLTWESTGQVNQLRPQIIQYQQTDPAFAKLAQTTADCLNAFNTIFNITKPRETYNAEDINRQSLCGDMISQGINQFCENFATFDINKCAAAREMSETYVQVVEALFG
jgi:hypothetical protein